MNDGKILLMHVDDLHITNRKKFRCGYALPLYQLLQFTPRGLKSKR
jgi:hypothetical protein